GGRRRRRGHGIVGPKQDRRGPADAIGTNTYSGGTSVTGGLINFSSASNFGSGTITLDGGGLQWASGTTTDISSKLAAFGSGGANFDTTRHKVPPPAPPTRRGHEEGVPPAYAI